MTIKAIYLIFANLYILSNTKFVSMINELSSEEIDRIESDKEKKYIVTIPEWKLEDAKKEISEKNSENSSDIIWFIDSKNRLSKLDFGNLTLQEILMILSNSDESEMLKEELLKKIDKQPDSYVSRKFKLYKHGIIKDED